MKLPALIIVAIVGSYLLFVYKTDSVFVSRLKRQNPGLYRAIAMSLEADAISNEDVLGMESLSIYADGVESLEGIEMFRNLRELRIYDPSLKLLEPISLTPLKSLKKLESLDLPSGWKITDVDSLSTINSLEDLNIGSCLEGELDSVFKISGLEGLSLENDMRTCDAPVVLLSSVAQLKELRVFTTSGYPVRVGEVADYPGNLEILHLVGAGIRSADKEAFSALSAELKAQGVFVRIVD